MVKDVSENSTIDICLMGASMDTGNRGVSALAASVVKIFRSIDSEAKISFFIGNRLSKPQEVRLSNKIVPVKVVNYRLSPKAHLNEHLFWIFFLACLHRFIPVNTLQKKIIHSNTFLSGLDQSDLIGDINKGDSFSDIYGIRRLITTTMPSIIALLIGKRLILLPQTYGPFKTSIGKQIARFILSRSELNISRDQEGIKLINKLTEKEAKNSKNVFCPDVAFMLDSIKLDKMDIHPSLENIHSKPIIGLNINGLMYSGGYTRKNMFGLKLEYDKFIQNLVRQLLENTEAHILLVPHTYGPPGGINSDPDASWDVIKRLSESHKDRLHMVINEYDQSELKWIISNCDFFIGSRMHACIASLSQGIPTVAIAYSKKFIGVFDSIGSGDTVIDARLSNNEDAINKIFKYYKNRKELCIDAKKNVAKSQERIKYVFTELLKK
jgi:polysaccharide pyruvyl transferase WcaK-like protein